MDTKGNALYIKPDAENPNDFFVFDFDHQTGTANMIALNSNIRAKQTIKDLGLQSNKLLQKRSRHIGSLTLLVEYACQGDERALALVNEARQPSSKYSAWVIALCRLYGIP